jgi:hypothetical protein
MKTHLYLILFSSFCLFISCNKNKEDNNDNTTPPIIDCAGDLNASSNVIGYSILEKLTGIWNGPVSSPTPLGSFPEWIVDFRPISPSHVSAKNELDELNDIFMSFFLVKHDCSYKIAFRNGGGFAGAIRSSYMLIDSISETANHSFYRFSDPVSGGNRVYTELIFKDDSLKMQTYTNHYNTLSEPSIHMTWNADLRDNTSMQYSANQFNFPQKVLIKDFSTSFEELEEAVFYNDQGNEPFPESDHPYVGVSTVNVSVTNPSTVDPNKRILIIVTTQPLFDGFVFQYDNLDFRSRYVLISAAQLSSYNFNYMHPGQYYINAIYDENNDGNFSSGDFMNSSFDVPLTLSSSSTASANVVINFEIP